MCGKVEAAVVGFFAFLQELLDDVFVEFVFKDGLLVGLLLLSGRHSLVLGFKRVIFNFDCVYRATSLFIAGFGLGVLRA